MLKLKNLNKPRKIILAAGFLLVAILTWFIISLATMDTTLEIVNLYKLPQLTSIKDLDDLTAANYAVAIDGQVVTANHLDHVQPTASTAKMILALAIMDKKPFNLVEGGETITISADDYAKYRWYINNGGSVTAVQTGEEISQYNALVSVLLASSNNMADTLAKWAFGSQDAYREHATNLLHEWGISGTTIGDDASGFSDTTTSTAADLAAIGAKVLENPVLAEIVATKTATIPVAGTMSNTNQLLGKNNIIGVKTGYIGDASGYCVVTGYREKEHIITVSLLDATTRQQSFDDNLAIIGFIQSQIKLYELLVTGETIGFYDSWWTGPVAIRADSDLTELAWQEAEITTDLTMSGDTGEFIINISNNQYRVKATADEYAAKPTLLERIKHLFGWEKDKIEITVEDKAPQSVEEISESETPREAEPEPTTTNQPKFTNATSANCTIGFGKLMLINPNFTVEDSFIATRRGELVSISSRYGIIEGNPYNGDNLLDAEAAIHINDMINAYKTDYPGHTMETRSCFRSKGTQCGRLCAATGASDHHTGLTCDLIDPVYGTSLDTDHYNQHIEWQWLRANSYKYGFIDRFPEAWAGGSMSEPLNVDANGSTGLYETWHYRYVGIDAAREIATGKYNNGQYDSLEHYLKSRGMITDLKNGKCQ